MRQKKNFFTKNNRLDKVGTVKKEDVNLEGGFLLDSKTLADFEKVSPGFSDKLFNLVQDEQSHNQKMDQIRSSISRNAMRMGRVSFVFIFVAICYFTYNLLLNNMINQAFIFAAISFVALIISNCSGKAKCEQKPENKVQHKTSFKKPYPKKRHFNKRK